jgi:tripeptidyl-peptidase-1
VNTQGPGEDGVEANLDVQYTTGIATEVPVQFLSVGGNNFATSLLDTTTFLDGVANPPSVMTTSYGSNEAGFGASMATLVFYELPESNALIELTVKSATAIWRLGPGV